VISLIHAISMRGSSARLGISNWAVAPLLIAVVLGVFLAADGKLHWDEPHYLYVGSYLSVGDIVADDVQSSGLPNDWIYGRILHILTVKALMSATGPGMAGYHVIVAFHALLILASLILTFLILREVLPGVGESRAATYLLAMSPVVLYLMFKTMPDTQALAASILATYAILRCAQGAGALWCGIAAMSLSIAILTKCQGICMPATFCAAALFIPIAGIRRGRLLALGALGGIVALLLSTVVLEWLGVGVGRFLGAFADAFGPAYWWPFSILNAATELGLLWLLLPIALLSSRRRELGFMLIWLMLSMAPFLTIFFRQLEPRHITVNLVAAAGLLALALEAISQKFGFWQRLGATWKSAAALMAVVILMGSNWIALDVMPHEADLGKLRAMLQLLNAQYGAGNYTVLAPWGLNEFHLIRVLWPAVDVRDVEIVEEPVTTDRLPRRAARDSYYGARNIESIEELSKLNRPLVYLGTQERFAEGTLKLLRRIAPAIGSRWTSKFAPTDHLYTGGARWLWANPSVRLEPLAQVEYYYALRVLPRGPIGP
jgi:hypothetical protein